MGTLRKPFQGVANIVRFNWHFYLISALVITAVLIANQFIDNQFAIYVNLFCLLVVAGTLISLSVSYYVYDLSDLYSFKWMDNIGISRGDKIVNINAGFDETSSILKDKFPDSELVIFDFYDPTKNTEISIERARKAYPAYPNTQLIEASSIPLPDNYADCVFVILAAHEIRKQEQRTIFFKELNRVTKPAGKIFIMEHLRDLPNFLAYNFGFFHFLPKSIWYNTFDCADLIISEQVKKTPFITIFNLEKNGNAS
jgi:ubiquinone/menaquinone biosynthesis C-methylase UbiE